MMGWTELIDENDVVVGIAGDEPWDIMGDALEKIIALYLEKWGRPPTNVELEQIFYFVLKDGK